jgi:hypothetical protein
MAEQTKKTENAQTDFLEGLGRGLKLKTRKPTSWKVWVEV